MTDRCHLSRCQDWILTSLVSLSPAKPITATELAAELNHDVRQTQIYLEQLVDMGLVRSQDVSGEPAWRPSAEGLAIGTVL